MELREDCVDYDECLREQFSTLNQNFIREAHLANPIEVPTLATDYLTQATLLWDDNEARKERKEPNTVLLWYFINRLAQHEPGLVSIIAEDVLESTSHIVILGGYMKGNIRLATVETMNLRNLSLTLNTKTPAISSETDNKDGVANLFKQPKLPKLNKSSWKMLSPMKEARSHTAATVYNGDIYVLGGKNMKDERQDRVFRMKDTGDWEEVVRMREPRQFPGSAVFQDKLYVIGGFSGQSQLATVEYFDGHEWKYTTSLNKKRANPGVTEFQGYLYVVGGHDGNAPLHSVERFDGTKWEYCKPMQNRRQGAGVAVYNGLLCAVGGYDGTRLRSMEIFDGDSWRLGPEMKSKRSLFALVEHGSYLYALAGFSGQKDLNCMEVFDGQKWRLIPDKMHTARVGLAAVVYDFGLKEKSLSKWVRGVSTKTRGKKRAPTSPLHQREKP
eukprot:m.169849 g.169849  ORF g.169849 m.169849 type:complete len:443 (+) comp15329_c1_seq1:352-1680(+)